MGEDRSYANEEAAPPELALEILGTAIRVGADTEWTLDTLRRLWDPFVVEAPVTQLVSFFLRHNGDRAFLELDGQEVIHGDDNLVIAELTARMNRAAIEQCSDFAVHSGVVEGAKSAVAFPAESGRGKSTLVAACLRAGFGYVSDEALCIGENGMVQPYPKPLALDQSSMGLVLPDRPIGAPETLLTASDFGSFPARDESALGHLVVIERKAGSAQLEPLTAGVTVERLLRLSFNHYRQPERAYRLAVQAAASAQAWLLEYDHPIDGAQLLFERLGDQ